MTSNTSPTRRFDTKRNLLEAARRVLVSAGYSGLSTRAVAGEAGVQMSQIGYHFGSKEGLILALFDDMNRQLIDRQTETFARDDLTFAEKWARSCDYLDDDLASGYVAVLQELIAAGWSNAAIGSSVQAALAHWRDLMVGLARAFEARYGTLGPFTPEDIGALGSAVFLGAEACLLLGYSDQSLPIRQALRRVGRVIAFFETVEEP